MEQTDSHLTFDVRDHWPTPHARQALKSWSRLDQLSKEGSVSIDGESLDVASVVAIARFVESISWKCVVWILT
jgi:phenylalanine ammonia-lyase